MSLMSSSARKTNNSEPIPLSAWTPWLAGAGGLLGGFPLYALIAGLGGGVTWEDRFAVGQTAHHHLSMAGILFPWAIALGATVGAPLGAFLALRLVRARGAGPTALLAVLTTGAATALVSSITPTGEEDPILLPYAVFGSWLLAPLLTRWAVEKMLGRIP